MKSFTALILELLLGQEGRVGTGLCTILNLIEDLKMIKGWERWEFQPLFPAVDNVAVPLRVFRPAPHRQSHYSLQLRCTVGQQAGNCKLKSGGGQRLLRRRGVNKTAGKLLLIHIYCLPATASAGTGTAHSDLRLSSIHNKY